MKPQFTLRDMFWMTTLIAVGVTGLRFTIRWGEMAGTLQSAGIVLSYSLISVGLAVPFMREWK